MVIAPENFRDEELLMPKAILEEAGVEVTVASKGTAVAKGMLGAEVLVDKDVSEISVDEYDGVIFVGGGGAQIYFDDLEVLELARKFHETGKLTTAICIAPVILANAGILEGKNATVWSSATSQDRVKMIEERGAKYSGESVVSDGNIITADGPDSAQEFGKKIVEVLA